MNDGAHENNATGNYRINNNKTTKTKSFEYKTNIIRSTPADNNRLHTKVVVPLKYLSNFWRSMDLLLMKCEIELNLRWTRNCIISEISRTAALGGDNLVEETTTISASFEKTNANLYIPAVTLSINNNIKFLKRLKQSFRRTVSLNKYRSGIKAELKSNSLDCMIDPTFRNINRLFVFSFKNGDDDPTRNSFDEYYMPLAEIKDFNALIDNKTFFDQPVKKRSV